MQETWVRSLSWRSPGEGKGYPLQYFGLENSLDDTVLSDGTENGETEYVRGVTELDTTERLSRTGWFTGFTFFTTFQLILYVSNDSEAPWFHSFAPRCPFLRELRKVECGTDNRNAKEKEIKGLSESIYDHTRCYCSVAMSCLTLCDPMDCSMPGFPVLHHLLELAQTHVIELVMPCNHLILCCPLLLLPSIFPSTRVFSNESALCIRWPKFWSFSFSISPSIEYSGLISFRIDWCDLLAVIGTLKSCLQHHSLKA